MSRSISAPVGGPGPVPVTSATTMLYPHGGRVLTFSLAARTVLTPGDTFIIGGCAFPTPCIRVVWSVPLGESLNSRSVGVCLNISNVPQGPVTIV